ncbi:MAG: hypothetical protein JXA42_09930 [Anaerolineales bacterium]|nr:hypothetical protein [Anaerolineales bacterium]
MEETKQPERTHRILVAGLLCVGLCLSCLFLAVAIDRPIQIPGSSTGLPITACAGIATQPRVQVGVAWVSVLSSYLPPIMTSRFSICFSVPIGQSIKSISGQWAFPP